MIGEIWASPNSLLGVAALATCGRWKRHKAGHFEAAVGSAFDKFFGRIRKVAITLGDIVIYRPGFYREPTISHERRHQRQYHILGPAFLPVYLGAELWSKVSGDTNWLEQDARQHAGQED